MQRQRIILTAVAGAFAVSGCAPMAAQNQAQSGELRKLVMETRRELEEVRKDQERLRALVEYLQYSDDRPAATSSYAGQAGDPRWNQEESPYSFEASPPGGQGDLAAATPPDSYFPDQPGQFSEPAPGAPPGGDASPETTGGIVSGVRGGGNWTEPGESGIDSDVPHVPVALRGSGFDDGVRAFVDQNYDDAIQYFRDYIHSSGQSSHADDAQYWIGESYLRKGLYSNAIKEFNQVVLRYSSGDRSASALLKLAGVFSKIGDDVDARLSLQKLVNRYPGTEEARRASSMLRAMGG